MKKQLIIEGMSCGHCVNRVEKALRELNGVEKVEVDLSNKKAVILLSETIEDAILNEVIDDAGYEVIEIKNV
ncbi:heavy-metal-associated domain-containing protein [Serpentinicella alkaliphila]|uniref:Copper chaperone CopZ n=1 Tax=Serpentinicella alkaliphila TaxID=1734049 RepID=A0A4R2TKQ4_9FIRM|nr:copper ion binding protein [Serpentinicella alkaliphila]QUH25119.1 heavy-metal-associated domain-containing protein [Serpentinicella alkaliphila]TCQ01765.1 copper ion binding protein [Serpentinicella alkaliphila]